jgi:GABA(A) receptor-associated protein
MPSFKAFGARMNTGQAIRKRFPNRVPIRLRRHQTDPMEETKFLAPEAMSVREFNSVVRVRHAMPPEKALFVFVRTAAGTCLPAPHRALGEVYAEHCAEDGCLLLIYSGENTFGYNAGPGGVAKCPPSKSG